MEIGWPKSDLIIYDHIDGFLKFIIPTIYQYLNEQRKSPKEDDLPGHISGWKGEGPWENKSFQIQKQVQSQLYIQKYQPVPTIKSILEEILA